MPSGPRDPLKVPRGDADLYSIMAEADRPARNQPMSASLGVVPRGLLAELTAPPPRPGIRIAEVARGRRHAANRAYDDGAVVAEIANELLKLSAAPR